MSKLLDFIFKTTNQFSKEDINTFTKELTDIYLKETKKTGLLKEHKNRILIIIPGYSVSNPPRIGHHLQYIQALKYHPKTNPLGYERIYLFDIYSKKDGRCNFLNDIPQLANELFISINSDRDDWDFQNCAGVDFLGASMGGLIVRKFIQEYLQDKNTINTKKWGKLSIRNILLIATPNFGCKIVDKLQNPILQFILRIRFGKNNFARSEQFKQIRKGNEPVFGKFLNRIFNKQTSENTFLRSLNAKEPTPGNIRWITIAGTKKQWFSRLLFNKEELNDGVVESAKVQLSGAENIFDYEINENRLWNHRDLYLASDFCCFLFGLLSLEVGVQSYKELLQKYQLVNTSDHQIKYSSDIYQKYFKNKKSSTNS